MDLKTEVLKDYYLSRKSNANAESLQGIQTKLPKMPWIPSQPRLERHLVERKTGTGLADNSLFFRSKIKKPAQKNGFPLFGCVYTCNALLSVAANAASLIASANVGCA